MIPSKNRYFNGARFKSSSLIALNEIDEFEKRHDWRKNYIVKPKEIGRGFFSKVFQVTCKTREQSFAAKVIRRKKGGIDRLDKIRREAEIIKKLNDKTISAVIQLYETYETFSEVILICELAIGGSLYNLIEEFTHGLNQNYVKCVIYKILKALECMHLENIVHLDIKADNILLREPYPSTNIAICDFGLATELKKGMNYKDLVGTPDYMAPEIINYEKITFNADMWSVGVLIYYLSTGLSPFMGSTKDETLINVSKVKMSFHPMFNNQDNYNAKDLISALCVKLPGLRLSSSTAQDHKWFNDIHYINMEYPLGNTSESMTLNFLNGDINSQSNDNLNNYVNDSVNIKRSQSVDLWSVDMNSKFPLENTHNTLLATSDEVFIDNNEASNSSENVSTAINNSNTPAHKQKSIIKLMNVDEVADETCYENKRISPTFEMTNHKSNINDLCEFNSNPEILTRNIKFQKNNVNNQLTNPIQESHETIQSNSDDISEILIDIISQNPENNDIGDNNIGNGDYKNDQNSQLKLSQIEINPNSNFQQLLKADLLTNADNIVSEIISIDIMPYHVENRLENGDHKYDQVDIDLPLDCHQLSESDSLSDCNMKSTNLFPDPIDEYENISDTCDGKISFLTPEFQRNISTNSDYDEDDDYRYTSLLAHFRIFELCILL